MVSGTIRGDPVIFAGVPIRELGNELWSQLSGFDSPATFLTEQRDAFPRAFDSQAAMTHPAALGRGVLVCTKGEFEHDPCLVLKVA